MLEFCRYELKYRMRMISTYVFGFIMIFAAIMYVLIAGGVIDDFYVGGLTHGDKVAINSPYMLNSLFSWSINIAMFILMVFIGQMFSKDFDTKFHDILFTKPITKRQYIFGRMFGNFILIISIYILCILVFKLMLFITTISDDILVTPLQSWYMTPMLLNVIPNLYFICTLLIAVVIFTKKTSYLFITVLALLVIQNVASVLAEKIDYFVIATLVDPFGTVSMALQTKGWTAAEKNTQLVGLYHLHYLNRIIWLGLSTALLFLSWKKFEIVKSGKWKVESSAPTRDESNSECGMRNAELPPPSLYSQFSIFNSQFKLNLRFIFKSQAFYWLSVISIVLMCFDLYFGGLFYGTSNLPVTNLVADALFMNSFLFMLIIVTYFTGELVWVSRDNGFNQIEDCLPISSFHRFFSKFLVMVVVLLGFVALQILIGITIQTVKGYYNYEIGVYLQTALVYYPKIIYALLLAFFFQNILGNKYIAHFALIFVFLAIPLLNLLGIEHHLFVPFSTPSLFYTNLVGLGNDVPAFVWFNLYWFLWLLLLTGVTVMAWRVGVQQSYMRNYLKKLKTKPVLIYNISVITALTFVSGFILYNTNILHSNISDKEWEKQSVDYERRYNHFKKENQPKIQDIVLNVAIYPYEKRLEAQGTYLLKNVGDTAIDSLLIHYSSSYDITSVTFSGENIPELITQDSKHRAFLLSFNESLTPGDSLTMSFDYKHHPKGFTIWGSLSKVYKNNTFIDNKIFPTIGYNSKKELSSERRRAYFGLPPRDDMPAVDDPWGLSQNYISGDADWISYRITVSTSADQIALAPGELVKSWTTDDRNYYTYEITENALNFYSILSGKYEVLRSKYNDIDLEVYYHKDHDFNIKDMMESMKASLEYYSNVFGPYRYSVLRIAEFPLYASYAQSFPTLIPFSEGIGFLADLKKNTINYPFYITAHEVSHQWWAHQLIGGFNRGAVMLSESFTEYASLMVIKNRFSDKLYREQLRYTMNEYLSGRSHGSKYELPLTQVENQKYLMYEKGKLVMNATGRLIGEDVLNTAMGEFIEKYRFAANPYPSSADFMKILDPYVPDSLKSIVDDMFNKIVVFDHKITKFNTETDNGAFLTTVEFTTEKRYYDEKGNPESVNYEGWLEIAFVNKDNEIIHLDKIHVTQKENKYQFTTNEKPNNAIIDPYFLTLHLNPLESSGSFLN